MACDQVCVLCDSLCSCVDGLRPSRDRAAVGSTVAGHRGGHACPRRLHLMACVETKHPATRSALGRAARGSRAPAHSRSSSGDIPTAICNRQISSTTTIKVERVPLRTARAINSRHGPARVSRRVCPGACVPAPDAPRCGKTAKSARRRRAGGTSDESGVRRQTKKYILNQI